MSKKETGEEKRPRETREKEKRCWRTRLIIFFFTKSEIVWEYAYATLAEEEKTKKAKVEIGKSGKKKEDAKPCWY